MNKDVIVRSKKGKGVIHQGDAASVFECTHEVDLIVLCAEEFQPEKKLFAPSSLTVIYAPNDDSDVVTKEQLIIAVRAAREVAKAYLEGKRVLVTCMAGRNRSGLVTAIACCLLYGVSGNKAKRVVQARRKGAPALTNPLFNRFLSKIPARPARITSTISSSA